MEYKVPTMYYRIQAINPKISHYKTVISTEDIYKKGDIIMKGGIKYDVLSKIREKEYFNSFKD